MKLLHVLSCVAVAAAMLVVGPALAAVDLSPSPPAAASPDHQQLHCDLVNGDRQVMFFVETDHDCDPALQAATSLCLAPAAPVGQGASFALCVGSPPGVPSAPD